MHCDGGSGMNNGITARSREAADNRAIWTQADHEALMAHLRDLDASWQRLIKLREAKMNCRVKKLEAA